MGGYTCVRVPAAGFSPECCHLVVPPRSEGAGKAGRRLRPQSRVRRVLQKCTRVKPQVQPSHPGFPRAMVLRLIRDLPGEAAFLAPVAGGSIPANVAPGSRRQDHTTSPSAASVFVRHASMPDAVASI